MEWCDTRWCHNELLSVTIVFVVVLFLYHYVLLIWLLSSWWWWWWWWWWRREWRESLQSNSIFFFSRGPFSVCIGVAALPVLGRACYGYAPRVRGSLLGDGGSASRASANTACNGSGKPSRWAPPPSGSSSRVAARARCAAKAMRAAQRRM